MANETKVDRCQFCGSEDKTVRGKVHTPIDVFDCPDDWHVERCPDCLSDRRDKVLQVFSTYKHSTFIPINHDCDHPWHSSPVPEGPQSSETVPVDARTHPVTAEKSANDGVEYSPSNTAERCGTCGGEKEKPLLLLEGNIESHGKWHSNTIVCAVKPKCTKCADIFHKRAAQPSPVVQTPEQVTLNRRMIAESDSCVCTPGNPCVFHRVAPVVPAEETERLQDEIDRLCGLISEVVGICAPGPLGHFRRLDKIFGRIMDVQTRALHFDQWKEANAALPATEKDRP